MLFTTCRSFTILTVLLAVSSNVTFNAVILEILSASPATVTLTLFSSNSTLYVKLDISIFPSKYWYANVFSIAVFDFITLSDVFISKFPAIRFSKVTSSKLSPVFAFIALTSFCYLYLYML